MIILLFLLSVCCNCLFTRKVPYAVFTWWLVVFMGGTLTFKKTFDWTKVYIVGIRHQDFCSGFFLSAFKSSLYCSYR